MKEKSLTKKQLQMLQDVNKFLFLKSEYNKLQDDFEYVSSKLNERLNHILYIVSDSIGVKSPRILHWINIECDNDKLAAEEKDLGFQNEEEEISLRVQPPDDKDIFVLGLYPEDPFPMPSFPTWFFWESDKKIAAYCKKFK
jgi:hypothetical protein